MGALLQTLGRVAPRAIVILDAPPVLATSEASALARHVDQAVLVIEADKTSRAAIGEALNRSICPHIGLVEQGALPFRRGSLRRLLQEVLQAGQTPFRQPDIGAAMYAEFYGLRALPFQLTPDKRSSTRARSTSGRSPTSHEAAQVRRVRGDHRRRGHRQDHSGRLPVVADRRGALPHEQARHHPGPDDTLRMVASGFGLDLSGSQKSTIIRQLEKFFTDARRRRISP